MKTPYVTKGYHKDQLKTKQAHIDGWMHSGDRGDVDQHGYVRIMARINDAFKTAKGSFVTPNPIEELLSKNAFVEQVCVVGIGSPQPIGYRCA